MAFIVQLAVIDDFPRLLPMVETYHEFENITMGDTARENALRTLLTSPSLGSIWLIFTNHQLAGYIALTFGYSIEFGGRDAFIDEFYIQPQFRGLGLGQQTLKFIQQAAKAGNVCALHLEVARDNENAKSLYTRANFRSRDKYVLMSVHLD
ncbi:MAG: GNAT family N-acetyltransferase [Leptolyngbyaceae cyanobacterium]